MSATESATQRRRKVHVPFDTMTCPLEGCEVRGAVPGVKRHAKVLHNEGAEAKFFETYEWPPNRTGERAALAEAVEAAESNEDINVDVLRNLARERGVSSAGLKKPELIEALASPSKG